MNPQQRIQGECVLFFDQIKALIIALLILMCSAIPRLKHLVPKVTGCSATETNGILAGVDVEFGLSSRSSGTPSRLLYEMNLDSQGRGASTTSPISTSRDFSSGLICGRC